MSCAYHARLKSPLSSKKDAEATEVLRTWKKMSLRTIESSLCACVAWRISIVSIGGTCVSVKQSEQAATQHVRPTWYVWRRHGHGHRGEHRAPCVEPGRGDDSDAQLHREEDRQVAREDGGDAHELHEQQEGGEGIRT